MKTKKHLRFVALLLVFSMCFSFSAFAAESADSNVKNVVSPEDIRTDFESNILEENSFDADTYYSDTETGTAVLDVFDSLSDTLGAMYDRGDLTASEYESVAEELRNARNDRLDQLGAIYYILTRDNIHDVEAELQTDFSQMGIDFTDEASDASILIMLNDGTSSDEIAPQSSVSASTTYTYNGTTYYLRMLTLTSDDYSFYAKHDKIDLLTSKTETFVKGLLRSALGVVLTIISENENVGYIYSLLDLAVSSYDPQGDDASLEANFGASWRRIYRQVWNSSSSTWVSGSCVECAVCTWALWAFLYNTNAKRYDSSTKSGTFTKCSAYYYDLDWQRLYAVLGYLNGRIYYDKTGSVSYTVAGSTVMTLSEPAA